MDEQETRKGKRAVHCPREVTRLPIWQHNTGRARPRRATARQRCPRLPRLVVGIVTFVYNSRNFPISSGEANFPSAQRNPSPRANAFEEAAVQAVAMVAGVRKMIVGGAVSANGAADSSLDDPV